MKKYVFLAGALALLLVLVVSVALVSADQPAVRPVAQAVTLEGPRWILISYAGKDGKTIETLPGTQLSAQFENGRVSGSAGCNNYSASYKATGNKLTISQPVSTMMACLEQDIMEQEAAYLANLQAAASYRITGDQLIIASAKGATVLTFKAGQPITLTSGAWLLTSYNNGKQAVVGVLPDVEVTAIFGADGTLSGSGGCNRYSAPYAVEGNKIQIGLALSTMMACAEPIMAQEQAYLAALAQAATYRIEGAQLELRDADGALLAAYTHQPATALVGPTWLLTGYNNGKQAVVSVLADTEVTALFGEDGTLSGSAGCNRYNAPYEVDGANIRIGLAATTRMMCEQQIMDQEKLYLAALETAATHKVEGSKLELRTADGALAAAYVRQAAAETAPAAEAAPAEAARSAQDTFIALRPTADGGVETITLHLDPSGSVEFASSSDQASIKQTGAWQSGSGGAITVTLTDQDGQKMAQPAVATFKFDGPYLTAVEYDKAVFGEGLKLAQVTDVARKVGPALVTIDLAAGFPLDPTFMSVNGGGEVDASLLGADCKGYINRNPVVTVNWTGDADLLRGFFYSDSDSTLVVLTPDGKLICSDNANEQLLDPVVEIKDPAPGKYRIWVGSAASRQRIPGILVLTARPDVNLDTFDLAKLVRRPTLPVKLEKPAPAVAAEAIRKELEAAAAKAPVLKPGASLKADVIAEGDIPLFQFPLTKTCGGLVAAKPSFVFKVAGKPAQVRAYFEGDADSTLLVVGDSLKTVECNDDAEAGNTNPQVQLTSPAEGVYAVYVGRLDPSKPIKGTLTVSAAIDAAPAQK
jgi:heat shock protein HslJ